MDSSQPGRWTVDQPDQLGFDGPVRGLKLAVGQGRINVIGTDGPPTLEVTRITGQPLNVQLTDGQLKVVHGEEGKPNILGWLFSGRRQEVDLSLALPPDALVELNVVSGAVVVSNFHEQVAVRGVSGEITLAGVHGSARVNTVSGSITAEQVTGDIKVNAISGAITVIAGAGGRIDLNTVSGAVTVDLEDPMPSEVSLQCVSGALTIRLPYEPDVKVDLSTAHGRVATSFPDLTERGWHNTRQLTGQIGTGQSRLRGSTVSGAVTLLRRSAEDDYRSDFEDDIPAFGQAEKPADDQNGEESR
ncbi:MAG TPA: DUF4097 family beta strand repeat-containing protein [Actinocrinis sp.]|nr:DUF4097 family beta strand repeat-containing protein [Actinocrinis sp.]